MFPGDRGGRDRDGACGGQMGWCRLRAADEGPILLDMT